MGNENDYNDSLKRRRPRTSGRVPLLCIEQRDFDDGAEREERLRQLVCDCGLLTDGEAETYAKKETDREVAARLAVLELLDPSQQRPTPKPNVLSRVDFIDL